MNKIHYVFHITSYYIAWFVGILLAAHGQALLAGLVILVITGVQIIWQMKIKKKTRGLLEMVMMLTVLGSLVDTFFLHLHVIDFRSNPLVPYFSPPWMILIWMNFAVLFYSVLGNFFYRYLLLAGLALVAFPLAYVFGVKLGAANFPAGYLASLDFGVAWAVLFPISMYFYNSWMHCHA